MVSFRNKRRLIEYFIFLLVIFIILNLKNECYHEKSLVKAKHPKHVINTTLNFTNVIKANTQITILTSLSNKTTRTTESIVLKQTPSYIQNSNPKIQNNHYINELLKAHEDDIVLNGTTPPKSSGFLIILIQIHSRSSYLHELIKSLSSVKGIQETLVVFSHDDVNTEMNEIIKNITFVAVNLNFFFYFLKTYSQVKKFIQ